MPEDESATLLCLWCRRVICWGTPPASYDLCARCVPHVVAALAARPAEPRRRQARPCAGALPSVPAETALAHEPSAYRLPPTPSVPRP